jgi:hypothetical protein
MTAEPIPEWVDPNLINYVRDVDQNPATRPSPDQKKPAPKPPAGREDKHGKTHK